MLLGDADRGAKDTLKCTGTEACEHRSTWSTCPAFRSASRFTAEYCCRPPERVAQGVKDANNEASASFHDPGHTAVPAKNMHSNRAGNQRSLEAPQPSLPEIRLGPGGGGKEVLATHLMKRSSFHVYEADSPFTWIPAVPVDAMLGNRIFFYAPTSRYNVFNHGCGLSRHRMLVSSGAA